MKSIIYNKTIKPSHLRKNTINIYSNFPKIKGSYFTTTKQDEIVDQLNHMRYNHWVPLLQVNQHTDNVEFIIDNITYEHKQWYSWGYPMYGKSTDEILDCLRNCMKSNKTAEIRICAYDPETQLKVAAFVCYSFPLFDINDTSSMTI